MGKGYQIVEPKALSPLLRPGNNIITVAILSWICAALTVRLQEHTDHVEFEVICVTYMGSYPSIGIHYKTMGYDDIGTQTEEEVERLLNETYLFQFISFISERQTDWKAKTEEIMS